MHRFSTAVVIALVTLLFVSNSSAQQTATTAVPNLIRYSGTLKDLQGPVPPGTPLGVTFAIYKQQDGGAAVWQETQNVTPDASGQYSVILGSTTATGLPDDLFSQQEQRWLGVQVQGQDEQARVLLVSVPYAFKAHEAETLGGLPASAFIKAPLSGLTGSTSTDGGTTGNAVGIAGSLGGTSRVTGADGKLPPGPCNPQSGYITYWDSTGALCASQLFQLGTNIGIGITNPSKKLDVDFNINARQWYDIGFPETRIVAVHTNPLIDPAPGASKNLFLGWSAGGPDGPQQNGALNTFTGFSAGFNNNAASFQQGANTYNGAYAGFTNARGISNTMLGTNAGFTNADSYNTCVGSSACQKHNTGGGNTMVGNSAGLSDATGKLNSFFGDASGLNNVGDYNTFLGDRAGAGNNGNNNTFSGYQSGFVNTANGNSFYGYQTGLSNNTGNQNAFFGNQAGFSNTTGSANTFYGNGAGFRHVDNNQNTFVGTSAGFNDFHGKANTFIGASAGQTNGSGNLNTYVGVAAGINGVGSSNTFIGNSAGFFLATGDFNTFSGVSAGFNTVGGSYNSYYGYIAGNNSGGGSYNSYYGYAAGNANVAGGSSNVYLANFGANESHTIRIGNHGATGTGNQEQNRVFVDPILFNMPANNYDAVTIDKTTGQLGHLTFPIGGGVSGSCTDPLSGGTYLTGWVGPGPTTTVGCAGVFQATNGNIGIGTTAPSEALDVAGDISANPHGAPDRSSYQIGETTVLDVFGSGNTILGFTGGHASNTGTDNTFLGSAAGSSNITGSNNIFVGAGAGSGETSSVSNNIEIGSTGPSFETPGNNQIIIGFPFTQTDTYVAGIFGSIPGASGQAVCVDSLGKLWSVVHSDECGLGRSKGQITERGDSSKLAQIVAAQQDVIKTQQEQINDLQQRLSRLESLIAQK